MRFRKRVTQKGENRVRTAFLFWPKTLALGAFSRPNEDDFVETRWLERANWVQRYDDESHVRGPYWQDKYWVEIEDEE